MALAALALTACQGGEESAPAARSERAVQIVPHQVSFVTETTRVEAVGTARARTTATIYPETSGEVTKVNFDAGDRVETGEVLVQLEARAERLAVRQAEVALKDAQRLIDRYDRVSTPGVIAGNELDRAKAAYDAAEIELDIAQDALERRTVRAPFTGYVGLTDIDPGARITTDTVITRLDDRDVLYVDFPAPEQTFGRVETGDVISIEPFSEPDQHYQAEIVNIDSSIDTTTRAYTIRAAIVWGGDGAFLWAVDNGRAKRVSLTIVSREEGYVLVKAGLQEGDWIIEEGVQKVREGTPVETPGQTQSLAGPGGTRHAEGGPTAGLP
ncbi:efflux RND transporter periplasmic adaptor subunit [Henriciella aquimarina]|uniref:efflux RND transporter periplasmic adaptor subunit n=1 Tax=Henriciella aquimarina TaxID=545261 RepID=UPI001F2D196E|nr:efflux RND transporter periplasmic adaptor subunit [Henriciella aquimarina]